MKKITFICLGNICRSPMAEFVMKDLIKKNKLEEFFSLPVRVLQESTMAKEYILEQKLNLKALILSIKILRVKNSHKNSAMKVIF